MSGGSEPVGWLGKARQDLRAARRLMGDPPELEVAAYHVQQGVEKAMKAALAAAGIKFPRGRGAGHDLSALAKLIPVSNSLRNPALDLADLTPWATAFRYPADDPLTAEIPPTKGEIERRVAEAESFVDAVALQVALQTGSGAL